MKIDKEKEVLENLSIRHTVKTIINNVCLEDAIDGFKTDNISGRTVLSRSAKVEESESSGSFVRSNKFSCREIYVEFSIKVDNKDKLINRCELLNYYLSQNKDVEISFTDDRFIYVGQVVEIELMDECYSWVIGKFKILCNDINKYGELITIKDFNKFKYDYMYPIIPEKIIVKCNNNSQRIRILNSANSKIILLLGDFKSGDIIEIYPKRQEIKKGSQNMLKFLNITSNLEDFEINFNDDIVTENCTIDIEFRETGI